MNKFLILFIALLLVVGAVTSLPSIALADTHSGIQFVQLNDRNANEKGASGFQVIGPAKDSPGIIDLKIFHASNLSPNHRYYLWYLIQAPGEFDPDLTISPNCFRGEITTNINGKAVTSARFPGPAAALSPGTYRVDTFVTHVDPTDVLDSVEANLIREAKLGEFPCLDGYDLLLSSEPFSTGIEVIIPE